MVFDKLLEAEGELVLEGLHTSTGFTSRNPIRLSWRRPNQDPHKALARGGKE